MSRLGKWLPSIDNNDELYHEWRNYCGISCVYTVDLPALLMYNMFQGHTTLIERETREFRIAQVICHQLWRVRGNFLIGSTRFPTRRCQSPLACLRPKSRNWKHQRSQYTAYRQRSYHMCSNWDAMIKPPWKRTPSYPPCAHPKSRNHGDLLRSPLLPSGIPSAHHHPDQCPSTIYF